jgi:hypothetical protein
MGDSPPPFCNGCQASASDTTRALFLSAAAVLLAPSVLCGCCSPDADIGYWADCPFAGVLTTRRQWTRPFLLTMALSGGCVVIAVSLFLPCMCNIGVQVGVVSIVFTGLIVCFHYGLKRLASKQTTPLTVRPLLTSGAIADAASMPGSKENRRQPVTGCLEGSE